MIIIGITGSIGTGKSTIASMMRILNLPVHDSDSEVKKILENNELVKKKVKKKWPSVISSQDDKQFINKSKLAEIVFKNAKDKSFLENMIHPIVYESRDSFIKKNKNRKIVVLDVPLLYETGTDKICDYIFLAFSSETKQKIRVLSRPNMTENKYNLIRKNQWSQEKKLKLRPYIISTSYGKTITFIIIICYLTLILLKRIFKL